MFGPKKILGLKNLRLKNFWTEKMFGPKKNVGFQKKIGVQIFFGKHHLCVTNRFLLGSVIVDLGWVLVVVLVLLVTWVNRTPKPLNSAKSP